MQPLTPNYDDVPKTVDKAARYGYDECFLSGKHRLFRLSNATQDRVVLEIQRGCIRGCRFCQAGMIYRPVRRTEPGSA